MPSSRRVQPTSSSQPLQQQQSEGSLAGQHRPLPALSAAYHRVLVSWHDVQIGNRGHYSVERVLAFRDYYERTSTARAVAVCVTTPVPAAVVMLLINCIPVRPAEEGWKANKTMFVRVLVTAVFVGGGIVFLAKAILSEGKISTARAIWITIASAVLYTALGILLAATWKYSIPFGMVLMVFPFVTVIMTLLLTSIDPRELKTNKRLQKQVVGHMLGSSAQSLLVMAYPIFNAVFLQLSGVQQAIFMLVLPLIKFSTKQVIAGVATHLQDFIGVVIVFTVDVFNVLYVAICMQTARSSLTTVLIVSSDVVHIVLALRSIYYHTNAVQERTEPGQAGQNFVNTLLSTLGVFRPRTKPYSGPMLLFGPYTLPLSSSSKELLRILDSNWNEQPAPQLLPSPPSAPEQTTQTLTEPQ